ncbi:DMT family transporter [Metabacillus sp. KIGAM252]|uniref:DMT family transporter n=1 Tax=Metabacillus flavus TaxID=2823519 RepID=A0ABS5LCL1_9BACI|nr:DMT family transporter [Metabacillus flavus]MBS2968465.1 DMT family transporter [Metabacillus flavus]
MSIIMAVLALFGGVTLSAQSSINGAFSKKTGTFETSFFTFLTGFMFLTVIVVFFGEGNILNIVEVPKWQLICAILGTAYMFLTVLSVPFIGVTAASIATVIGQLGGSMLVDHFGWFGSKQIPFEWDRGSGVLLMILALFFIFKGNKKASK